LVPAIGVEGLAMALPICVIDGGHERQWQ